MNFRHTLIEIRNSNFTFSEDLDHSHAQKKLQNKQLNEYLATVGEIFSCDGFDLQLSGNPIHFFGPCDIHSSNEGYPLEEWKDKIVLADEGGYPVSFRLDNFDIVFSRRIPISKGIAWEHVKIADSFEDFVESLLYFIKYHAGEVSSTEFPSRDDQLNWISWLGMGEES